MLNLYVIFAFAVVIIGLMLIIIEFKRLKKHYDSFHASRLDILKKSFQHLKDEDEKASLQNKRLDKKISEIDNLYQITKEMSAALQFLDIFKILAGFLKQNFVFKDCRLILMKYKESDEIDKIYCDKPKVHSVEPDEEILNLVKKTKAEKDIIKIKNFLSIPLIVEDKIIGILAVENLSPGDFDYFLILSRQFILEIKKARLYERVQELAITDGLTGAYVRRHFLERLEEELERSRRHKFKFSFLLLDIDHFKEANDTYGHIVGDAVLAKIVHILKANIRQIDLVARYGGEEFSVLLPETGKKAALVAAERIRAAIAEDKFKVYDEFTNVSVSIGLACFPEDAAGRAELIEKADTALYRAKKEGRNRVCSF